MQHCLVDSSMWHYSVCLAIIIRAAKHHAKNCKIMVACWKIRKNHGKITAFNIRSYLLASKSLFGGTMNAHQCSVEVV